MPVPFDAERGREARVAVAQLQGDLARLIEGACGCSPYLKTLVEKEAAWLPGALEAPEAALDAVLDAIMQAPRCAAGAFAPSQTAGGAAGGLG